MRFLLLCVFILTGCSNAHKEGSCVVDGNYKLHKIIEVGTEGGYLLQDATCGIENWNTLSGGLATTDCFNTFNHCKER